MSDRSVNRDTLRKKIKQVNQDGYNKGYLAGKAASAKRIEELQAKLDAILTLLKLAKCPDTNCDGKGTVCLGEYQHESGEVELHLEQCRWCDERDAALQKQEDEY